jgi:hypothetical protein
MVSVEMENGIQFAPSSPFENGKPGRTKKKALKAKGGAAGAEE